MSLNPVVRQLQQSMKDLIVEWQSVKGQWRDSASRDFEKQHLEPLEPASRAALTALSQMDEVIGRAKRDCSE